MIQIEEPVVEQTMEWFNMMVKRNTHFINYRASLVPTLARTFYSVEYDNKWHHIDQLSILSE